MTPSCLTTHTFDFFKLEPFECVQNWRCSLINKNRRCSSTTPASQLNTELSRFFFFFCNYAIFIDQMVWLCTHWWIFHTLLHHRCRHPSLYSLRSRSSLCCFHKQFYTSISECEASLILCPTCRGYLLFSITVNWSVMCEMKPGLVLLLPCPVLALWAECSQ